MMDLVRDPRWGRVMESAGEDPYLNSLFAQSYVYGYQGENPDELSHDNRHMAVCIKHIATYGAAESRKDYNTAEMSDYTLREFYLLAYKAAVEAGVMLAMTSFNTISLLKALSRMSVSFELLLICVISLMIYLPL